ncbi:MAG: hypothetical protein Ta2A_14490 [Treponemataceae bacterium]|nr:MAG: hypothetical protein Ta2A_14490 [Treponemataceae bacterium]
MKKYLSNVTMCVLFVAAFVLFSPILQGCSALFEPKLPPSLDGKRNYGTGSVKAIKVSWMYAGQSVSGYANSVTFGTESFATYPVALHETTTTVLLDVSDLTSAGETMTYILSDMVTSIPITSEPIVTTDYKILLTNQIETRQGVKVVITLAKKDYVVRLLKTPIQTYTVYVSNIGNGLHNDDEYAGNELRGRSPGMAFYSLSTAIRKAVKIGANSVTVLSDLDFDQVNYVENKVGAPNRNVLAGDSVFYAHNASSPGNFPLRIVGKKDNSDNASTRQIALKTGGAFGTPDAPRYTGRRVFTALGKDCYLQFEYVKITGGGIDATNANAVKIEEGGGIYIADGATVVLGAGSEIADNKVKSQGGGVFLTGVYSRFESSGKIHHNAAGSSSTNFGQGGGIYVNRRLDDIGTETDVPPVLVLKGDVYDNSAHSDGGGVYIGSVKGGSLAEFGSGARVFGNRTTKQQISSATSGESSGVYYAGKKLTISGNAFVSNCDNNFLVVQNGSVIHPITVSGTLDAAAANAYNTGKTGYTPGVVVGLVRHSSANISPTQVLAGDYPSNYAKFKYNWPTNIRIDATGKTEAIP